MSMASVRCPVLGAHVTRVTDFEGNVTQVICPAYDAATGTCRMKTATLEGGPLSQLLERMAENGLATRGTTCVLRAA